MLLSIISAGMVYGLASALHCAAMCGAIACGALMLLGAPDARERNRQLALMQVGRIMTYAALGTVAGLIGGGFAARAGASFEILQWAAAIMLAWTGLVIAGAIPRLSVLDRGIMYAAAGVEAVIAPVRGTRTAGPLTLGIVWGLNACPMLYGAVFFSSLTGSALNGFLFMSAFGAGTVPAVVGAAKGLTYLRAINGRPALRWTAGAALAIAGFAGIYVAGHNLPIFCLSR